MHLVFDLKVEVRIKLCAGLQSALTVALLLQIISNVPWYVKYCPGPRPGGKYFDDMLQAIIWDKDLHGCFGSDPQKAQKLFQQHIEEVKRVSTACW